MGSLVGPGWGGVVSLLLHQHFHCLYSRLLTEGERNILTLQLFVFFLAGQEIHWSNLSLLWLEGLERQGAELSTGHRPLRTVLRLSHVLKALLLKLGLIFIRLGRRLGRVYSAGTEIH